LQGDLFLQNKIYKFVLIKRLLNKPTGSVKNVDVFQYPVSVLAWMGVTQNFSASRRTAVKQVLCRAFESVRSAA